MTIIFSLSISPCLSWQGRRQLKSLSEWEGERNEPPEVVESHWKTIFLIPRLICPLLLFVVSLSALFFSCSGLARSIGRKHQPDQGYNLASKSSFAQRTRLPCVTCGERHRLVTILTFGQWSFSRGFTTNTTRDRFGRQRVFVVQMSVNRWQISHLEYLLRNPFQGAVNIPRDSVDGQGDSPLDRNIQLAVG